MARSLNKTQLIGNLGADPISRSSKNNNSITTFSMGTGESWIDSQTGKRVERTEWHRVVVFGKIAEVVAEYAKKGHRIFVEGKNRTRSWEDDKGIKRYTTEVVVDIGGQVIFLEPRKANIDDQDDDVSGREAQTDNYDEQVNQGSEHDGGYYHAG